MSRLEKLENMVSIAKDRLNSLENKYNNEPSEYRKIDIKWAINETEDYIRHYETLISSL